MHAPGAYTSPETPNHMETTRIRAPKWLITRNRRPSPARTSNIPDFREKIQGFILIQRARVDPARHTRTRAPTRCSPSSPPPRPFARTRRRNSSATSPRGASRATRDATRDRATRDATPTRRAISRDGPPYALRARARAGERATRGRTRRDARRHGRNTAARRARGRVEGRRDGNFLVVDVAASSSRRRRRC